MTIKKRIAIFRRKLFKLKNVPATSVVTAQQPKRDVIGFYDFLKAEPLGIGMNVDSRNVPADSITWVIPDFGFGSGGHLNIFRFVHMLEQRGFNNQIINITGKNKWGDENEALNKIREWFFPINTEVTFGDDGLKPSRYLIATSWETAYTVNRYRDVEHKFYFVQDFEPYFFAHGSVYHFAMNTYKMGFRGITAGNWLKSKLSEEFGMECESLGFSYDKELYKATAKRENKNINIFFYARPPTCRREFEMGLLALNRVCEKNPDCAVIFAGWDVSEYKIPFNHLNAGVLKLSELPDLFSQCDAGLVLSGTNLSLLPLEMMSCNCPVVINKGAHNEWLFGADEAVFVENDVESIAQGIEKVINDSQYRDGLIERAKVFAASTDWDVEGDKLAEILKAV